MAKAADDTSMLTLLYDAFRAPGWSEAKVRDWIEDRRLWWSGYSQAQRKDVTSDEFRPKFAILRVDPDSAMHVFWSGTPGETAEAAAENSDTIEGVRVRLPKQGATTEAEASSSKATAKSWLPQAVKDHPRPPGVEDYAGWLLQFAPKRWQKKTIQNALARLKK